MPPTTSVSPVQHEMGPYTHPLLSNICGWGGGSIFAQNNLLSLLTVAEWVETFVHFFGGLLLDTFFFDFPLRFGIIFFSLREKSYFYLF